MGAYTEGDDALYKEWPGLIDWLVNSTPVLTHLRTQDYMMVMLKSTI